MPTNYLKSLNEALETKSIIICFSVILHSYTFMSIEYYIHPSTASSVKLFST